jgi:hypothetical protein
MNRAYAIIKADLGEYLRMRLPIQAYDAHEAATALEAAGIDLDTLPLSPIEIIDAVLVDVCLASLAQPITETLQ